MNSSLQGRVPPSLARALGALELKQGGRYGLACSGGLDSTVLLAAVARLLTDRALFVALHVDHGLRPAEEQKAELETLARNCLARGIALYTHQIPPGVVNQAASLHGLEAAARTLRYQALERWRSQLGLKSIIMAHHRDDLVETRLLALFRGQVNGGILTSRPGYLRPFLTLGRRELVDCARIWNLKWHEDSTNSIELVERNRLRQRILPFLEAEYPGLRQAVANKVHQEGLDRSHLLAEIQDFHWQPVHRDHQDIRLVLPGGGVFLRRPALLGRLLDQAFDLSRAWPAAPALPTRREILDFLESLDQGRAATGLPLGHWRLQEIAGDLELGSRVVAKCKIEYVLLIRSPGSYSIPGGGVLELSGGPGVGFFPVECRPLSAPGLHGPGPRSKAALKALAVPESSILLRSADGGVMVVPPRDTPGFFVESHGSWAFCSDSRIRFAKETESKSEQPEQSK